jgi:ketosteroid isomerase-like protein
MAILDLIGSSPKFQAVLDEINTVAPVNCAVLVQGETGTGKEVIAQAIHDASPRRQNSFVALNCAAIPGALLRASFSAMNEAPSAATKPARCLLRLTVFVKSLWDLRVATELPFSIMWLTTVDWTVMGTQPLTGQYLSKKAFIASTFAKLGQVLPNGAQLRKEHLIVKDDRAVVELHSFATAKNGMRFDNRYCWVVYFRDGVIVRVRAYLDSAMVTRLFQENPIQNTVSSSWSDTPLGRVKRTGAAVRDADCRLSSLAKEQSGNPAALTQ